MITGSITLYSIFKGELSLCGLKGELDVLKRNNMFTFVWISHHVQKNPLEKYKMLILCSSDPL